MSNFNAKKGLVRNDRKKGKHYAHLLTKESIDSRIKAIQEDANKLMEGATGINVLSKKIQKAERIYDNKYNKTVKLMKELSEISPYQLSLAQITLLKATLTLNDHALSNLNDGTFSYLKKKTRKLNNNTFSNLDVKNPIIKKIDANMGLLRILDEPKPVEVTVSNFLKWKDEVYGVVINSLKEKLEGNYERLGELELEQDELIEKKKSFSFFKENQTKTPDKSANPEDPSNSTKSI